MARKSGRSKKKSAPAKRPKAPLKRRTTAKAVVVTLSGERPIAHVKKDLEAKGFQVAQALEQVGSITGIAAPGTKAQLKKIRGVADVSDDHPVDIGPPDAAIS